MREKRNIHNIECQGSRVLDAAVKLALKMKADRIGSYFLLYHHILGIKKYSF